MHPVLIEYETLNYGEMIIANPNYTCTHFPRCFWSSYVYLVHCQSEDSHAHLVGRICPNHVAY